MLEDIKYRGPLSEREFRIMGWICLAFTQVSFLMRLGQTINPALAIRFASSIRIVSLLSSMALPFLLVANFSAILKRTEKYSRQIFLNLIFLVLFGSLYLIVFYHYGVGLLAFLTGGREQAIRLITDAIRYDSGKKYVSFNLFVDLFLCSLISFFLFYRSSRPQKKYLHIMFRLCAVLPIGYEVGTIYLKYLAHSVNYPIPIWAFPLLPVKPPMTFVLFIMLALFVKKREIHFCRHGRSYDEYLLFLQTNRNSLHFSIYASVTSFLAGLIDLFIYFAFTVAEVSISGVDVTQTGNFTPIVLKLGFGDSVGLILFAPILMLFSYNRKSTDKTLSALIPVAGVVLIILIYLQGFYQLLQQLPAFLSNHLDSFLDKIII